MATYGTVQNEVSCFPLIYAGQTIGELIAAPRAANESFTPADQRLLNDLARQISISAQTVMLDANLEQARLRLITERGEARRQLGRDLHDDVGHQLVGLTRQVESVIPMSVDDPKQAQNKLTDINHQLEVLTSQVRELAHQLFPPELEVLGLSGALRERIQFETNLKIHLDVPQKLPPLPAETEIAAYYIALEALTNVEKHAQAKEVHLRLEVEKNRSDPLSAFLVLDIRDDGIGLPDNPIKGLGMLSIQARAVELGGTYAFDKNPSGGTAVIVRIPCTTLME